MVTKTGKGRAAAHLENREVGGGTKARRVRLHPRRAPYGRHWSGFSEVLFGVGGPSNYIFLVNTFAIGGRRTTAKGAFRAQEEAWLSAPPPAYAPGRAHLRFIATEDKTLLGIFLG